MVQKSGGSECEAWREVCRDMGPDVSKASAMRSMVRSVRSVVSTPAVLAAGLVLSSLAACSGAAPAQRPLSLPPSSFGPLPIPESSRVMVKLRDPSLDRAAVAAQAQVVAGVPVQANGAVSPEWQALALDCADAAACEAAVARLRADTGRYVLVEIDRRERALPVPRDRALSK
ncbi:MAG: hypothetical protein JWQ11_1667 [Rhizobacter sp.]|nr:hypothetical protein [Rhizobacter sp.]